MEHGSFTEFIMQVAFENTPNIPQARALKYTKGLFDDSIFLSRLCYLVLFI